MEIDYSRLSQDFSKAPCKKEIHRSVSMSCDIRRKLRKGKVTYVNFLAFALAMFLIFVLIVVSIHVLAK